MGFSGLRYLGTFLTILVLQCSSCQQSTRPANWWPRPSRESISRCPGCSTSQPYGHKTLRGNRNSSETPKFLASPDPVLAAVKNYIRLSLNVPSCAKSVDQISCNWPSSGTIRSPCCAENVNESNTQQHNGDPSKFRTGRVSWAPSSMGEDQTLPTRTLLQYSRSTFF